MLESLDESVFSSLEDAYGPAVDVPRRLRLLAEGTLEQAREALGELEGGIFHQGSYYPAAAAAVPFLIEIASAERPVRGELLLLLADMSGAPAEGAPAFDPFVFRSTPGPPDYPEATATVEAIARGRAVYVAALSSASPAVRASAAYLLACLGGEERALGEALERETDQSAEMTLRLSLMRAGARLPPAQGGPCDDLTRGLGRGPLDERLGPLSRLLLAPALPRTSMPFCEGHLETLAIAALLEHRDDPRVWGALRGALEARLGRGEQIVALPAPGIARIGDEGPREQADYSAFGRDRPLRELASALTQIAFGERAGEPELLSREGLDERQRQVLSLTRDHGIPVPVRGAPWFEPRAMARFLDGGGPLDRVIEMDGESRPLFVHLYPIAASPQAEGAAEKASRVFEQAARELDDQALFSLAVDLLEGSYGLSPYGAPALPIASALSRHVLPRLLSDRARFEAHARSLLGRDSTTGAQAQFALAPSIAASEPCSPELDPLASLALAQLREQGLGWLRAFPEPRRSALVARLGNGYLARLLGPACEPGALPRAIAERFVDPSCRWMVHEAEMLLAMLPAETLKDLSAKVTGSRARAARRSLRELTGEGKLTLELRTVEGGVHATLTDWLGQERLSTRLSSALLPEELSPIVEACANVDDPLVDLEGDLDPTLEYRIFRLLPGQGLQGTVRSGGSSITSG